MIHRCVLLKLAGTVALGAAMVTTLSGCPEMFWRVQPEDAANSDAVEWYTPSTAEAGGMDGKGGLKVTTSPDGSNLPRFEASFDERVYGDSSTTGHPTWMLFHSRGGKSLALEFLWKTTEAEKHEDRKWARTKVAFSDDWSATDASDAKNLVLWVKTSHPKIKAALQVGIRSASSAKGREATGLVSLASFAKGKKIGPDWTKVVIPLIALPKVDEVDLAEAQELVFEITGQYPENEKIRFQLDNIYLTDADVLAPVQNVGYLVRGDGVLIVWDAIPSAELAGFSLRVNGKEVKKAKADQRLALIPRSAFKGTQAHKVSVVTTSKDDEAPAATISVKPQPPQEASAHVKLEARGTHAISPYIYGVNFATSAATLSGLGATVNRWGQSRLSKYNWRRDVDSAGSEWYYLNGLSKPSNTPEEDKAYYQWVQTTIDGGAVANFTIPIGPYVAKPHREEHEQFCSFPQDDFPKQESFDEETGCGNGLLPDGTKIWTDNPERALVKNSLDNQKEFLQVLFKSFPPGKGKGVRFVSLDNEPGLWIEKHRDAVPKGITAKQLVKLNTEYGAMVKSVAPSVDVIGFSAWGVLALAGSNADYMPPIKDGYKLYGALAPGEGWSERKKHGKSQLEYYLQGMRAAERKAGKRLIDVVDIHWIPQIDVPDENGELIRLSDDIQSDDPELAAKQFDALREWYDPAFENAESWTASDEENFYEYLWKPHHPVIPAFKGIIAKNYPGTKLAINLYDTGSRSQFHGALLRAAALGIFAQEGLYMASAAAVATEGKTHTYYAHKLLGDYDGNGSAFAGRFHPCRSTNQDLLSYCAKDGNAWKVLLVNKNPRKRVRTTIVLPAAVKSFQSFVLAKTLGTRVTPTAKRKSKGNRATLFIPPYSASVIVAQ